MMVNKLWSQESEGEPFHLYTDLRKRKRPRHSDGCKNLESQACVLMIDSICVCVCVCIFNSFIWLLHMACGISVPWPGIEPVPPVSEVQSSPLVVAVHLLSHVWLFATPWTAACQAPLSSTISHSLLKFHVHWVGDANHLILYCPLILLVSIFLSIRVFPNELALRIKWPKYWSFSIKWPKYWSFSISLSSEYSGLISFRIDWFDLLAVQGTLKSLLQHHSSKASIL